MPTKGSRVRADRRSWTAANLLARSVKTVLRETPTVIPVTPSRPARSSATIERVPPTPVSNSPSRTASAATPSHFVQAEKDGKIVDEHVHEPRPASACRIAASSSSAPAAIRHGELQDRPRKDRACRRCMRWSAASISAPAPPDHLKKVSEEIRALDPDVVVPMLACSADQVNDRAVRETMPDKLIQPVDWRAADLQHVSRGALVAFER